MFKHLLMPFIFAITVASCGKENDYIFIVDTSGSMKKNGQLQKVRHSLREMSYDASPSDQAHLVLFDENIRDRGVFSLEGKDLLKFYGVLDSVQATGQWTNLIGALDYSLNKVQKLKKSSPDKDIKLIIYTDGKHDLPSYHPDFKRLNFEHLFTKYFKGLKQKKVSWFIYYVELDQSDPAVRRFIEETGEGRIISAEEFQKFPDVRQVVYALFYKPEFYAYFLLISFFLHFLYYLFKPWFNRGLWLEVSNSRAGGAVQKIDLKSFKRKFFRNYVTIGKSGEISTRSSSLSKIDAGVGVDIRGHMFVRALSGCPVYVNDTIVHKKKRFRVGDSIRVGDASIRVKDN